MADRQPMTMLLIGLGGSGAWTAVHVKRQLLDAYDNELPANVSLVVMDTSNENRVALWTGMEIERRPGMGFGRVELDPSEYVHVGGEVKDLIQRVVRTEEYPHIKSWFMADRYLREADPAIFQLNKGAGQFRQFGRLALFRDVIAPAESKVRNILENKLVRLARERGNNSIAVMIVGSLAGGTGAGLFLDIAHLTRAVARANDIDVKLRGFFFLPTAFAATIDAGQVGIAKSRAFGALRELDRFLMQEDYQFGYPIFYLPPRGGVGQPYWREYSREKLFDFVYLIDGAGERRLNSVKIENGSASVVADAIVCYVDQHYGPYQEEYDANISSRKLIAQGYYGKRAFVSTTGSFSFILPVQQMIESWTFKLGRTVLEKLAPGNSYNAAGEIINGLSYKGNPQMRDTEPREAVENLLQSSAALNDANQRAVRPLPLWGQALQIFQLGLSKGDRALEDLRLNPLEYWRGMLIPAAIEADPQVRQAVADTQGIVSASIYDIEEAFPSDKRKPSDPDEDWRAIGRTSDRFIVSQLGIVETGGSRSGGVYKDALLVFVDLQITRFADFMTIYVNRTLNGTLEQVRDPIAAKTGKLGWLMAMAQEMYRVFADAASLLEGVRLGKGMIGADRGTLVEQAYKLAAEDMRAHAGERKMFGEQPYLVAQKSFLAAVDAYIDHYRTDFTRAAVGTVFQGIRDFLRRLLEELDLWKTALATDTDSLYISLKRGEDRISGERAKAERVANHEVIYDVSWENLKYQEYVRDNQAEDNLFTEWAWATELVRDGRGVPSMQVKARIGDQDLQEEQRGAWSQKNLDILLRKTRDFFHSAVKRESVLKFLMEERYADNAEALAELLALNAGALLSMPETATATRNRVDILLAASDGSREQEEYLNRINARLAAKRGQGDRKGSDSATQVLLPCDDPFRLTLLSNAELIPLEQITAYTEAKPAYMTTRFDTRQLYQIFPAEVRAVEYENDLRTLGQKTRMFEDRVVLLLEDETRLQQFLYLLAHGIIVRTEDTTDRTSVRFLYKLILPPEPRKYNEWWLTEPSANPSLLDAMTTYVVVGDDVRSQRPDANYTNSLRDRDQDILKYLQRARTEDTEARIQNDNLALDNDELRVQIEAFMPPLGTDGEEDYSNFTDTDEAEFIAVAELVVRYDVLSELEQYMRGALPTLEAALQANKAAGDDGNGLAHDEGTRRQEEYDLFTVSIVALQKAMQSLQQAVEARYNLKVGKSNPTGTIS